MSVVNGFTLVRKSAWHVGYTTNNGTRGKGKAWSGFVARDSDGYERCFDTKAEAVEFAENYG